MYLIYDMENSTLVKSKVVKDTLWNNARNVNKLSKHGRARDRLPLEPSMWGQWEVCKVDYI